MRTGQVSDLVALDVDLDKGGLDSLISLQQAGLTIRGTAAQLSGSGLSFHLLYRHPGGKVSNSAGRLGDGLDVRGDGGYVVGAPSRHPDTGARYELLGELTQLPVWRPPSHPEHVRLGECSGTQAARLAVAQLLLEAAASAGMTEHKAFDTLRGALQQEKATEEGGVPPLVRRVSARQSQRSCADQVWSGQPRRRQSSSRVTSVCGCWQAVRLVAGPISPSSRQRASMIRAATTRPAGLRTWPRAKRRPAER